MLGMRDTQEFATHNHPVVDTSKVAFKPMQLLFASVSHLPLELLGDIYAKIDFGHCRTIGRHYNAMPSDKRR